MGFQFVVTVALGSVVLVVVAFVTNNICRDRSVSEHTALIGGAEGVVGWVGWATGAGFCLTMSVASGAIGSILCRSSVINSGVN